MYISAATVKDDPALLPTLDTSVSEQKADLAKILPFLYVDGLIVSCCIFLSWVTVQPHKLQGWEEDKGSPLEPV